MIRIGDKAPDFKLISGTGQLVNLKDFKGKKIILYFYPKDNTAACTKEACSFQDNLVRIKKKGALVIGISADSMGSHAGFVRKHKLRFPVLSDGKKDVIKKYGVWKKKSMYGREYFGIERSTFIIDEEGFIVKAFRKVKVERHVDEIMAIL